MRNAATQEALRSTMRYRHGAIITKGGKILGQGHNHVRTGFSGPLAAHAAVALPGCGCAAQASGTAYSSYFSMHAEMHAVTSALRGAKPQMPRGSVRLEGEVSHEMAGSRFSDTSAEAVRATQRNERCDRDLLEGAKREQQRVAFSTQNEWCLKPRYKERAEEKRTAPRTRCAGRHAGWLWPVGR